MRPWGAGLSLGGERLPLKEVTSLSLAGGADRSNSRASKLKDWKWEATKKTRRKETKAIWIPGFSSQAFPFCLVFFCKIGKDVRWGVVPLWRLRHKLEAGLARAGP